MGEQLCDCCRQPVGDKFAWMPFMQNGAFRLVFGHSDCIGIVRKMLANAGAAEV